MHAIGSLPAVFVADIPASLMCFLQLDDGTDYALRKVGLDGCREKCSDGDGYNPVLSTYRIGLAPSRSLSCILPDRFRIYPSDFRCSFLIGRFRDMNIVFSH